MSAILISDLQIYSVALTAHTWQNIFKIIDSLHVPVMSSCFFYPYRTLKAQYLCKFRTNLTFLLIGIFEDGIYTPP